MSQKKGLIFANISVLITVILIAALIVPENDVLRGDGGSIIESPFMNRVIFMMIIIFLVPGVVFDFVTKSIKNDKEITNLMGSSLETIADFIVLIFFTAQFVA